jgi:hypothetical protein
VAQMQYYWADNQVSATITFKPEEAGDIPKILELYETRLKSISFLPLVDHNYPQAPYQEITKEVFELAAAKLKPLDFAAINTDEAQDLYCDGEKCELPKSLPKTEEFAFPDEDAMDAPDHAPIPAHRQEAVPDSLDETESEEEAVPAGTREESTV